MMSGREELEIRRSIKAAQESGNARAELDARRKLKDFLSAPSPQEISEPAGEEAQPAININDIPEVGAAPELNKLSMAAFKASLGLLTTGDSESLKGIFSENFGDDVSFSEDMEGNQIVSFPSGSYALNKPGLSGQDIARAALSMAAFTPAGRAASFGGAAVGSGLTEAAIQGTEQALGGEDVKASDLGLSAALGGAFKVGEKLIGGLFRGATGSPKSEVVEAGRQSGIPVLTSDVIQPKTFPGRIAQQTGEKIPLAGTGGIRETQQEARKAAVKQVINRYGEFSYSAIADSLKAQKSRVKNAAGKVLEGVGNKLDDIGEVGLSNTRNAIREVQDELTKKGVIRSDGPIADIKTLSDALDEMPQTFTSLKENRTLFMEIVRGADKAERSQLTSRAKSLLQRVSTALKQDMDDFAKKNLTAKEYEKWQKANSVYAQEAKELTKTKIKNILDVGDLTPEAVDSLLFSRRASDITRLYNGLSVSGKDNARSAIINKVLGNLSRRQSGITPNSFETEMKKFGLQTEVFFKGEKKQQLNGLLKALSATRRAQDAAVTTPTGQSLLGAGTAVSAAIDLGATLGVGGTLGAIARLYESAPVRNALLRLNSVPAGSTSFERALRELTGVLASSAQTMRRESRETE